jgi:hypothetical protein
MSKEGFLAFLGITKVKRRPVRERIAKAQIKARKLAATTEVVQAREKLTEAAELAFGKLPVRDHTARQNAVDKANELCAAAELLIEGLEPPKPQNEGTLDKKNLSKQELKDAEKRVQGLTKDLAFMREEIKALRTPKPPALQPVMLPSDVWSVNGLLGALTGIELAVSSAVVTQARELEIRDEILELGKLLGKAQNETRLGNEEANQIRQEVLPLAKEALKQLAKDKVKDFESLPIFVLTQRLESQLVPGLMLTPDSVRRWAAQVRIELQSLANDKAGYIKGAQDKALVKKNLETFDNKVNAELDKLRLLAEPLQIAEWTTLYSDVLKARASLGKTPEQGGTSQTADQVAQDMLNEVTKLRKLAEKKAEQLRKDVKQARKNLLEQIDRIKDTKTKAIYALDWKLIDNTQSSIHDLLPDQTPPLEQLIPLVVAIQPLVDQLTERVKSVESTLGTYANFDTDFAKLEKDLETASKTGALKTWDEASLGELNTALNKLKKDLASTPAASSFKAWETLKQSFEAKKQTATEVNDYWVSQQALVKKVEQQMASWQLQLQVALLNGEDVDDDMVSSPNSFERALADVELARSGRPVDLAKLKDAINKLTALVGDGSPAVMKKEALDSRGQIIAEDEQKQKDEKAAKQKLKDRLYGVDLQVTQVKLLVKAAKGEEAPLKRLEELLKKAEQQIESINEKAANSTMDLIIRRIGLIQAHPEGEPARNRGQLDTLHKEWVAARTKAHANLNVVHDKMLEHMGAVADGPARSSIKQVSDALAAFRTTFTEGPSPLLAPLSTLADENTPDDGKRKAREDALATVADLQRRLRAHPMTSELAKAPLPAARAVPASLMRVLDRLHFTVLTSVG